jgi:hypothetical protein
MSTCGHKDVKEGETNPEQMLRIAVDGSLQGRPKTERLMGVCNTDDSRTMLICELYNGLPEWTITGVTMAVTWFPYRQGTERSYQLPVVIKPRTRGHVQVNLGVQLPLLWSWQNVAAKGYRPN